jgi:uncharacterized membrane protein
MSGSEPYWTDERVDTLVGNLLRAGVTLAAAVVLFGAILYLVNHGSERRSYTDFTGEPERLERIDEIVTGALTLHSRSVIQFGLLLLLATPVARVMLSVVVFALQRDRLYVVITLIVLALLLFSLFGLSSSG